MDKTILLTGASGFVGQHLARILSQRGYGVVALDQRPELPAMPGVETRWIDLADPEGLVALPRVWWGVIHLAGASVPSHFATSAPVISNLQITLNLLEHLEAGRVILVSSCHVYAPADTPRHEDDAIVPQGRYGLSKHLCEQLLPHYQQKLDIRVARPFNHIGSGMRPALMIPSLVRRILDHPPGDTAPVVMKGLNSIRDFIDVRDVASGYLAMLELEAPSHRTFNICTGIGHSIEEVVRQALEILGAQRSVEFESHPSSLDDIPYLVGDPGRLQDSSGWRPAFSLADSLRAVMKSINT